MRCVLLAALGVWLLTASSAFAQDTDGERRARAHFDAGSGYFADGSYELALQEFRVAHELSGRPQLLYNIALTHERLGAHREAAEYLRRYLAEAEDVPNRASLERRIENLERRASSPATAPPPPEPSSGPDLMAPAIAAFAVGGAGALLYAIAGGLALDRYSALEADCGRTRSCREDEVSDVRTLNAVADTGLVVGAVGVAAGIVLLVVHSTGQGDRSSALQVLPVITADGVQLGVGGTL